MSGPLGMGVLILLVVVAGPGGLFNPALILVLISGRLWGEGTATCQGAWAGTLVGSASGYLAAPMAFAYAVSGWLAGLLFSYSRRELFSAATVGAVCTLTAVGLTTLLCFPTGPFPDSTGLAASALGHAAVLALAELWLRRHGD